MKTHPVKEELHRLIEELPAQELHTAQLFLEYLRHVGKLTVRDRLPSVE